MVSENSVRDRFVDEAVANIAARLERLPYTKYQRYIFLIIATAWFFDSVDLGALTFLLGSIRGEFHLTNVEAGFLSSASFFGMFLGASLAGMAADRFGRRSVFQVSMIVWGLGSILCSVSSNVDWLMLARVITGTVWAWNSPSRNLLQRKLRPPNIAEAISRFLRAFGRLGFWRQDL